MGGARAAVTAFATPNLDTAARSPDPPILGQTSTRFQGDLTMNWVGLLLAAAGVFSFCGGALDWSFFMESRKARFFVAILSRTGARIFYVLLGLALVVFGVLMALGIVESSSR